MPDQTDTQAGTPNAATPETEPQQVEAQSEPKAAESVEERLKRLEEENAKLQKRLQDSQSFIGEQSGKVHAAKIEVETARQELARLQSSVPSEMSDDEQFRMAAELREKGTPEADIGIAVNAAIRKRERIYGEHVQKIQQAAITHARYLNNLQEMEALTDPAYQAVGGDKALMDQYFAKLNSPGINLHKVAAAMAYADKTAKDHLESERLQKAKNARKTADADAVTHTVLPPSGAQLDNTAPDKKTPAFLSPKAKAEREARAKQK